MRKGRINRAGHGSMIPLMTKGGMYGIRVVFESNKTKLVVQDFKYSDYGTPGNTEKAARAFYEKFLKGRPSVYGLPLRMNNGHSRYPGHHLPHGLSYCVIWSNRQQCYVFAFHISGTIQKNTGKRQKLVLMRPLHAMQSETDFWHMQDTALDYLRLAAWCDARQMSCRLYVRGWQKRKPTSRLRTPGFSYMDVVTNKEAVCG